MPLEADDDKNEYIVLVNDEEQYSLWLSWRDVPAGWTVVGPRGSKKECLDYVEATWVDMTPKSLRRAQ
jgi:MbtH protein